MFNRVYGKDAGVTLSGRWSFDLYGPDGALKEHQVGTNVVCTNGKEFLASFLYSAAVAASTFTMKYIGVGSNNTAQVASDTALGTELARQTGTVSYVSNQIFRVTATLAAGVGTGSIVEYGLFSSSAAGTMLARDVQTVITKGASDTLTVTAEFTLG